MSSKGEASPQKASTLLLNLRIFSEHLFTRRPQRLFRRIGVIAATGLLSAASLSYAETALNEVSALSAPLASPVDSGKTMEVELFKASVSNVQQAELTLEQALQMALDANPSLKAAQDRTRQAQDRYQTKLAEMLPDVGVSFSRSHYNGGLQIFGNQVIDVDRTIQQPYLVIKFPLFKGGQDFFQVRSANRLLWAQRATEEATQQNLLRETAVRFYDMKRALSELAISQSQVNNLETHLKLTQSRMDAGVGTRLDVLQTQAQLAKARQGWIQATQNVQQAALELNALLDLPAMVQPVPTADVPHMTTLIEETTPPEALLKEGKGRRADLKALTEQIKAMKELRKIAFGSLLPEVNFTANIGATGPTLSQTRDFGSNQLAVDLLLRDMGLSVYTRWREKNHQINELTHQREAQENTVEKEIRQALLQSLSIKAIVSQIHSEIDAAQQAFKDAEERLKVGVGRNIDVLDAETQLTQAQQRLNSAITQYNQAQVNLVAALGNATVDSLTKGVAP